MAAASQSNSPPAPASGLKRGGIDANDVLSHFVDGGHLSKDDEGRIRTLAEGGNLAPGAVADRLGLIAQPQWSVAVGALLGLPVIARDDIILDPPDPPRLSLAFQEAQAIALSAMDDSTATLVIADPVPASQLKALKLALRRELRFLVSTRRDVEALIGDLSASAPALAHGSISSDAGRATDREQLLELANDAPTIRFVDSILARAVERRATDIHIEPFENKPRIRLRVDGMLVEDLALPSSLYAGVFSRLKILSGLDIGERRMPQDGRIRHLAHGAPLDIRVSTVPSINGESMALRLLDMGRVAGRIESLQMPADVLAIHRTGLAQRSGMIIVTGPTGSGKTTTLNALLSELNDATRKIMTVENPVEIRMPGVVQVEARPEIGLTFATALRAFLRQDPDVMMVGEIRDQETANIAIQAALTGHLVLSTLHTNDAPSAVTRLIDMGIEPFLVRSTLRMVVAQRLVRKLCPACAATDAGNPDSMSVLRKHEHALPEPSTWRLRRAVGCPACGQTGYSGRRAVFEALLGGDAHDAVEGRQTTWRPMLHHGLTLACEGITSVGEVYRVLDDGSP